MGITGLWDELGDGCVISIAKYASDHFEKTGRPLRIAIDEAGWRFSNLTPFQVKLIREMEPAANPVEKLIFYRIRRLLRFNVRLLFVFDGPRRPHKRGRPAGRIPYEDMKLLKNMLRELKIPMHEAPAEAEAECATLQQAGKVDAVWSEDGDSLMFGCTTLITNYRTPKKDGGTKKDDELVSLYTAEHLKRHYDITREGLVLFTMLSGGDYNKTGLRGCGPKLALKASQSKAGLDIALYHASKHQLPRWRELLQQFFTEQRSSLGLGISSDYPDFKVLEKYRSPLVISAPELSSARARFMWELPLNEISLRLFMHTRFNFWTKGYLGSVTPWLLVRTLASTKLGAEAENEVYEIQLKKRRPKVTEDISVKEDDKILKPITFRPASLTTIDVVNQPPDEDWQLATKGGITYRLPDRIEAEIPTSILKRGLGAGFALLEAPKPKQRKQKVSVGVDRPNQTPARMQKKRHRVEADAEADNDDNASPANWSRQKARRVGSATSKALESTVTGNRRRKAASPLGSGTQSSNRASPAVHPRHASRDTLSLAELRAKRIEAMAAYEEPARTAVAAHTKFSPAHPKNQSSGDALPPQATFPVIVDLIDSDDDLPVSQSVPRAMAIARELPIPAQTSQTITSTTTPGPAPRPRLKAFKVPQILDLTMV